MTTFNIEVAPHPGKPGHYCYEIWQGTKRVEPREGENHTAFASEDAALAAARLAREELEESEADTMIEEACK